MYIIEVENCYSLILAGQAEGIEVVSFTSLKKQVPFELACESIRASMRMFVMGGGLDSTRVA